MSNKNTDLTISEEQAECVAMLLHLAAQNFREDGAISAATKAEEIADEIMIRLESPV